MENNVKLPFFFPVWRFQVSAMYFRIFFPFRLFYFISSHFHSSFDYLSILPCTLLLLLTFEFKFLRKTHYFIIGFGIQEMLVAGNCSNFFLSDLKLISFKTYAWSMSCKTIIFKFHCGLFYFLYITMVSNGI